MKGDEPFATFRVSYKGGHPKYPDEKFGHIDLELYDDHFEFHPTGSTQNWFDPLLIRFDSIITLEFERTMASLVLSTENTIAILYRRKSGQEVMIRFQVSAFTVYGQEKKCRELKDLMRNRGILAKLATKPSP